MPTLQEKFTYADMALDVYYTANHDFRPQFHSSGVTRLTYETNFRNLIAPLGTSNKLGLAAYTTAGKTVVALDGWEDGILANLIQEKWDALQLGLGGDSLYLQVAIAFAYFTAKETGTPPQDLFFVGHSQGGQLAATTAAFFGADAYIFNPGATTPSTTALIAGPRAVVTDQNGLEILSLPCGDLPAHQVGIFIEYMQDVAALLYPQADPATFNVAIANLNLSSSSTIEGIRVAYDMRAHSHLEMRQRTFLALTWAWTL